VSLGAGELLLQWPLVSQFNNYDAFGVVWNSLRQYPDTVAVAEKANSLAYE
jgi:hypothetical protein